MLPSKVFPSQGYNNLTPSVPQISTPRPMALPSTQVSSPIRTPILPIRGPIPSPSSPYQAQVPSLTAPYRTLETVPFKMPEIPEDLEEEDEENQDQPIHTWRFLPDVKPPLYCVEDKIVYPGGPELTRQICAFFAILTGK